MAYDSRTANSGTDRNRVRFMSGYEPDFKYKRDQAQMITNFAKEFEYLQRNPAKNVSQTFTQYNKERIVTYLQSPSTNQVTIREISRFLWRHSKPYQNILYYLSSMPNFAYNVIQENDFSKEIKPDKAWRDYYKVVSEFNKFDIKKEGQCSLLFALRDGLFVGYMYDEEKRFFMYLDPNYVRIVGKNQSGQWVAYFDANYFTQGNNAEFVTGIDGNPTAGTWDKVFIDGYNAYQADTVNNRWFRLPPERCCVILACPEDEFTYPLPPYLPIFSSLLDLLDLESILQSRTELENYKLLVSQIPLVENGNSGDIDDFAVSLELSRYFNAMIQEALPELVGAVVSPMEINTISFDKSNSPGDVDELGKAIRNLFNNSGASEVVVAGGGQNPSTLAIKYSQINDMDFVWILVNKFESWLTYYISENISEGYILEIYKVTDYNRDQMIEEKRNNAMSGGSATDFICISDGSPYRAFNKLRFEAALDIRSLMIPLSTGYTQTSDDVGRPTVADDEISPSTDRTRNTDE